MAARPLVMAITRINHFQAKPDQAYYRRVSEGAA